MIFSQYDRFDLEQDIIKIWDIGDYIDEIMRRQFDGPEPLSDDELSNMLIALKTLVDIRAQRLFDGYDMILKHRKWDSLHTIECHHDETIEPDQPKKGKKK